MRVSIEEACISEPAQLDFYAALFMIPWLAPSIRRAILQELGIKEKDAHANALRFMFAALKAKGVKGNAAVAHLAKIKGLTVPTLKQRLRRSRPDLMAKRRLQKKSQR